MERGSGDECMARKAGDQQFGIALAAHLAGDLDPHALLGSRKPPRGLTHRCKTGSKAYADFKAGFLFLQ